MGLKLPKIPRQVQEMGQKPLENTPKPVPQQVMAMYNRLDEQQYNAIKAQWQALYRFGAPDPLVSKCAEVCCNEITNNHDSYYPFCSWDCKDWDEQIKRR